MFLMKTGCYRGKKKLKEINSLVCVLLRPEFQIPLLKSLCCLLK